MGAAANSTQSLYDGAMLVCPKRYQVDGML
jgi:hypothetical protein